jgi:hypothetical protein
MIGSVDVSTAEGTAEYAWLGMLRPPWLLLLLLLMLLYFTPRPDALVAPEVIGRGMMLLECAGRSCKV